MPHLIGALYGKHVAMDCPANSGSQDHNYKGFSSMVLLTVCDAKYNFTLYDVGQYGSINDSGVLLNSEMGAQIIDHSEMGAQIIENVGRIPFQRITLPFSWR